MQFVTFPCSIFSPRDLTDGGDVARLIRPITTRMEQHRSVLCGEERNNERGLGLDCYDRRCYLASIVIEHFPHHVHFVALGSPAMEQKISRDIEDCWRKHGKFNLSLTLKPYRIELQLCIYKL